MKNTKNDLAEPALFNDVGSRKTAAITELNKYLLTI
jgi:hypothetical protein